MIRFWMLFFYCFAIMSQAQQAIAPIDRCLEANAVLYEQILACDVAVQAEDGDASELVYLPPIIAELRGEQGDFDAAFAQLSEKKVDGADLLLAMGEAQFQVERFELAMIFFQVAVDQFPGSIRVQEARYQFLDDLRLELRSNDSLFAAFLSAGLRKSPFDPVLRNERAMAYVALEDIEKALVDWDVATSFSVYPHLFRFRRAEALWKFERAKDALEELKSLTVELLPGGSYETQLSNGLSSSNAYFSSLQSDRLQNIHIFRTHVYLLQMQIYVALSDMGEALNTADEWVDTDLGVGQPLLERAEILSSMGRDLDALEDLDHAVQLALQQENGEITQFSKFALWSRADLYIKMDDVELAMRDIDRVLTAEGPEGILLIQNLLTASGMFNDEIDGVYDSETKRAFLACIKSGFCDSQ